MIKNLAKTVGSRGETLARKFLKKRKIKILKNNYRLPIGEVDILAADHGDIVVVEVKTKSGKKFGHPAEMVNFFKRRKLIQIAEFLEKLYPNKQVRIDVVSVDLSCEPPKIEHLINAVTS